MNSIILPAVRAAAVLLLAASAASAADNTIITKFEKAVVAKALEKAGATQIEHKTTERGDHTEFVVGGLNYGVGYRVCSEAAGCKGLPLSINFKADTPFSIASANSFSRARIFTSAFVLPDGRLVLSRYLIADGGVTSEHLVENFKVFFQMPDELKNHLLKEAPVASLPGAVVPLAGNADRHVDEDLAALAPANRLTSK